MERQVYAQMASVEERHWWFVGRRAIIDRILRSLDLPAEAKILEVGCGTGGNLRLLARYGAVSAMESNDEARALAAARGLSEPRPGRLPDDLPFEGEQFDLVCLFDVLEHVDDDGAAMRALRDRLAPGGRIFITVPAYQWLWSDHDQVHHHKRRYTRRALRKLAQDSGFTVSYGSYFNCFLFPLAVAVRLLRKLLRLGPGDDTALPGRSVNGLLTSIFAAEGYLLPRFSLPVGLSILLVARR
jgi:SAM-dependent methyltransferase